MNWLLVIANKLVTKYLDELARKVIHGDWGNGDIRKKRLTDAGYDYNKVQSRVEQLMK